MNVIERIEEGSRPEPEPEPEAEAGGGTKMGLDEWIDRRLYSRFSSTKGREARGFHQTELRVTGRVHSCMARCVQSSQEGNPTLQSQMGLNQWVEGHSRFSSTKRRAAWRLPSGRAARDWSCAVVYGKMRIQSPASPQPRSYRAALTFQPWTLAGLGLVPSSRRQAHRRCTTGKIPH